MNRAETKRPTPGQSIVAMLAECFGRTALFRGPPEFGGIDASGGKAALEVLTDLVEG
ncbi:hypothetical protein HAL_32440 [Haladaptatus sp. T7]|nr:hypothetical protein HAL_32440 [Haladaptatus sp. T7]